MKFSTNLIGKLTGWTQAELDYANSYLNIAIKLGGIISLFAGAVKFFIN